MNPAFAPAPPALPAAASLAAYQQPPAYSWPYASPYYPTYPGAYANPYWWQPASAAPSYWYGDR
jgi:hypothetical protein